MPSPSLEAVNQLMRTAIESQLFPGAEILVAQGDQLLLHRAYGKTSGSAQARALEKGSIYDLASLTKPVATATAALKLAEQGYVDLLEPIGQWLPEWKGPSAITWSDLLTHRSGLVPWLPLYQSKSKEEAWAQLMSPEPATQVGTKVSYSCLNFLILAELVRRVSKQTLAAFCQEQIFGPLGLTSLKFSPGPGALVLESAFCPWRNRRLQGEVHDENAALFDGEGGNAGLFGTALDLWQYALMLLDQGIYRGETFFKPETARLMLENQNPTPLASRTIGWDYYNQSPGYWSCGNLLSLGSIGHLGYTGTGIWIDPKRRLTLIHLSHRVWYGAEHQLAEMKKFRPVLHNHLIRIAQ